MDLLNSGDARVRQARIEDVAEIAKNMRQSDKDEVWATGHCTPEEAVFQSFQNSTICLTVELAGRAVTIFGVCPLTLIGNTAYIWLLTTDDFCKIKKRFLHRCRIWIEIMLTHYPRLINFVDARNDASIKWLKWCGAKFNEAIPYGVEKKLFYPFLFEKV